MLHAAAFHVVLATALLGADPAPPSQPASKATAAVSAARAELRRAVQTSREALAANRLEEALKWAAKAVGAGQPAAPGDAQILAADDPERLDAILLLGHVQRQRKAPQAALAEFERVARLAKQSPSQRMEARLSIAAVRWEARPPTAEEAAELLAEADRALPPDNPLYGAAQRFVFERFVAGVLLAEANAAMNVAGVETAEAKLDQALAAFRKALTEHGACAATASWPWLGLAHFQWEQRRLAGVSQTLSRLAPVVEEPRFTPYFQVHYWNLCGLLETEFASFATARECYLRARGVAEKSSQVEQLVVIENNLGQLALRLGDYTGAERRLRPCVEKYAEPAFQDHAGRPFALVNLAKALEGSNRYGEAQQLLEQALKLVVRQPGANAYAECLCRAALAINRNSVGEFEAAIEQLEQARPLASRAFGERHLHVAELDVDRSWVELSLGNFAAAEEGFARALDALTQEQGENHPRVAETMAYLARAHAAQGRGDDARREILRAVELRQQYVERTLRTTLAQRDRLAFAQALRVHPESRDWPGAFDTFLELGPQLEISPAEQYRCVLAWKGIVDRRAPPQAVEGEGGLRVRDLSQQRATLLRELRACYLAPVSLARRKQVAAQVVDLEGRLQRIEEELQLASAAFARSETPPDATVEGVTACLPAGAALVDVVQGLRRQPRAAGESLTEGQVYYAFVIRPGVPIVRIDLGDAFALDDGIARLHKALEGVDPDFRAAAAPLAQRIRDPLAPHLQDVRLLLVAGDGRLNQVPLGVLPVRAKGAYWIEETAFAWIPHAQWLAARTANAEIRTAEGRTAEGLLAVGGVEYGERNRAAWPPLPHSGDEAREVARLFREARPQEPLSLLVEQQASKDAVVDELPRRRFVHLATHGYYRGRREEQSFDAPRLAAQLDSGLVLADAGGTQSHDQVFTAEEAATLDLRGLELITLSACQTGLGRNNAGQGAIGLVSALHDAGAKTVVGALWKIDDEATLALMRELYRGVWGERKSPASALQAAQIAMLRGQAKSSTGETFVHPKYWAAFTAFGVP